MVLLLIKNMLDAQESHPAVTYRPDRRSKASGRMLDVIAFFRNEGYIFLFRRNSFLMRMILNKQFYNL